MVSYAISGTVRGMLDTRPLAQITRSCSPLAAARLGDLVSQSVPFPFLVLESDDTGSATSVAEAIAAELLSSDDLPWDYSLFEPEGARWSVEELDGTVLAAAHRLPRARHVLVVVGLDRCDAAVQDHLLLTLEEPPAATLIVAVVRSALALPDTIRSRAGAVVALGRPPRAHLEQRYRTLGLSEEAVAVLSTVYIDTGAVTRAIECNAHAELEALLLADVPDAARWAYWTADVGKRVDDYARVVAPDAGAVKAWSRRAAGVVCTALQARVRDTLVATEHVPVPTVTRRLQLLEEAARELDAYASVPTVLAALSSNW